MMTNEEIVLERANLANRKANYSRIKENADRLVRLINNPDFVALIQEGYCKNELCNYLGHSVDDNQTASERADALANAQAAARFSHWITLQLQLGRKAEAELADIVANEEHLNTLDQ